MGDSTVNGNLYISVSHFSVSHFLSPIFCLHFSVYIFLSTIFLSASTRSCYLELAARYAFTNSRANSISGFPFPRPIPIPMPPRRSLV